MLRKFLLVMAIILLASSCFAHAEEDARRTFRLEDHYSVLEKINEHHERLYGKLYVGPIMDEAAALEAATLLFSELYAWSGECKISYDQDSDCWLVVGRADILSSNALAHNVLPFAVIRGTDGYVIATMRF